MALTVGALADREAEIPYAVAVSLLPGEIACSSATVGRAIEQFTTWHWLNTTRGVAFLNRDDATTGFGYAIFEPGAAAGTFQLYDFVLAVGVGMLRQLSDDPRWAPLSVHFSHARPASIGAYRRFFRAPPLSPGPASGAISLPHRLGNRPEAARQPLTSIKGPPACREMSMRRAISPGE